MHPENSSCLNLPAGEVTIQLEKKGYKTYRREKVILKEGMQIKLNFDISNLKEEEDNDLFHPLLQDDRKLITILMSISTFLST